MTPRDPHTGLPTAFPPLAPADEPRKPPMLGYVLIGAAAFWTVVIIWSFLK